MRKYPNRLVNAGRHAPSDSARLGEVVCPSCGLLLSVSDDSAEGVAVLLRLLTRLANCGLDAGARPLLQSVNGRS